MKNQKCLYCCLIWLLANLPISVFAQWTTVGDEVHMTDPSDVVLIGTTTNSDGAKLNVVGTDNGLSLLRVEADYDVSSSRELLRLEMPTTSLSTAQFIDMKRGNSTVFEVERDGNVNINSVKTSQAVLDINNSEMTNGTAIDIDCAITTGSVIEVITSGDLVAGSEMLRLTMPSESSTLGQFVDFQNGSNTVFEVSRDGNMDVAGNITVAGELTAASDQRFKKNISTLKNSTSLLMQLRPVSYDFRTNEFPALNFPFTTQYGFIAQDVEEIIPELVSTSKEVTRTNGESFTSKSINYIELIPLLTKAIQEQQEIIEDLQREVKVLSNDRR